MEGPFRFQRNCADGKTISDFHLVDFEREDGTLMSVFETQVLRDLAPGGRLRAAINFGNPILAQKHPVTGRAEGVSVELAHELGRRLGVELELVTFDAAGKVFEALKTSSWEVAFLAIDPVRSQEILFTAPYVIIEGTYLVREESALHSIEEFDQSGVRIAVGRGAAYDLFLTRCLKLAEIVRADTSIAAVELFMDEKADAAAGIRQQLAKFAQVRPGFRVIEGRFTTIEQAVATPRRCVAGAEYLAEFVEEMKTSGFISRALAQSGQQEADVAPAVKRAGL